MDLISLRDMYQSSMLSAKKSGGFDAWGPTNLPKVWTSIENEGGWVDRIVLYSRAFNFPPLTLQLLSHAVIGEIFGHNHRLKS